MNSVSTIKNIVSTPSPPKTPQIKTRSKRKKAIEKQNDGDKDESTPDLKASGRFFSEGEWFNINHKVSIQNNDNEICVAFNNDIFKINDQIILKHVDISKNEWKSGYIDEVDDDEILIVDQHGIGESIFVDDIYHIEHV